MIRSKQELAGKLLKASSSFFIVTDNPNSDGIVERIRMKKVGHTHRRDGVFSIKSIRVRLLLIMLALMCGSLSLLTGLSYYFSDKALSKSVNETAAAISLDYSQRSSAFVNELVVFVQDIAVNPHIVNPQNRQEIVDVLALSLQRNNKFTGINYGDLAGNVIRAQGDTAYLGDRDYYLKAIKTKELTISEPLVSKGSGRLSLAIAAPVLVNGEVKAVIQATMPLDSLNELVGAIRFMDSGYGFIADQSGVIIAHAVHSEINGKVRIGKSPAEASLAVEVPEVDERLADLFTKAIAGEGPVQGVYTLRNRPIFTVLTPVELPGGARWLLGVSAPESEVIAEVVTLNTILLLAALGCVVSGAFVIILISRRFARPEEKYFKAFRYVDDAVGIVSFASGTFIEVNDAFFELLGYERDEILARPVESLGLWVEEQNSQVQWLLKNERSVSKVETFWRGRNGEIRIGLFSADVFEMGKERYYVFVWHDITEQKKAEESLKKAYEELEQKVEERTQELFAANEELTAANEEMLAMNDELDMANRRLQEENNIRCQTEDKLLLRERQYRAATGLLTRPVENVEVLMEKMLANALQLVQATGGFVGIYNDAGTSVKLHHGIGMPQEAVKAPLTADEGPLKKMHDTGEPLFIKDSWWNMVFQKEDLRNSSVILIPLQQGREVKGVLAASWIGEERPLEEETAEVLRQFADLAVLALERAEAQDKISHMAFFDLLTGLPNRVNLNLYLEKEFAKVRTGAAAGVLFFIDMDDLKTINDTFGHSAGDKVIMQAGETLRRRMKEELFVARISGDEFVVVDPRKGAAQQAEALADQMIKELCQEYDLGEAKIQMSASIGIVEYPQHGLVPEVILQKADVAMYAAKETGRNCWHVFEAALLEKTSEDTMLINAMRFALEREEMFLQYQPQWTVDGAKIIGVEALLRWESREHGRISPARFIPLAERSRLILQIGQWVLRQACRFAVRLAHEGRCDVRVAVNISPRQIKDENFVSYVLNTIKEEGVQPWQIELEVTESVFIDHTDESISKLKQLKEQGTHLSVDDFGTGFSSLSYLRKLPVNCLKIDKSFVDEIASDDMQFQFVNSIINMGHTLGVSIVAEGVETKEQLAELDKCNCDYIQGFLLSKPLVEEEAMAVVLKGFSTL